jgi:hypothetical protein
LNITACDLCRGEIVTESPRASLMILLHRKPKPYEYVIQDVCERCLDSVTEFLDGLRTGPPGATTMVPDNIYTGPTGNGAGE